jgi:hypothetical protein
LCIHRRWREGGKFKVSLLEGERNRSEVFQIP